VSSLARPSRHLATSVALAIGQYARTRSLVAAGAVLLTGFLIDGDHFADYALRQLRPNSPRKLYLLAHGWEYVPLLAAIERRWLRRWTRGSLALAYVLHLGIDQVANDVRHPLSYSVIYRAARGFDSNLFGRKDEAHAWQDESPRGLLRWF
jgi:hypothetical protein